MKRPLAALALSLTVFAFAAPAAHAKGDGNTDLRKARQEALAEIRAQKGDTRATGGFSFFGLFGADEAEMAGAPKDQGKAAQ